MATKLPPVPKVTIFAAIGIAVALAIICILTIPFSQFEDDPRFQHAVVTSVIDGDTITARLDDGRENKVRMIGIDTPESVHPDATRNSAEGQAASNHLKSRLAAGTEVWLEKDQSETDAYDRWLRYVWLVDPTIIADDLRARDMLNCELVYDGWAVAKDYPPDTKYSPWFHALEQKTSDINDYFWYDMMNGVLNTVTPDSNTNSSTGNSNGSSADSGSGTGSDLGLGDGLQRRGGEDGYGIDRGANPDSWIFL